MTKAELCVSYETTISELNETISRDTAVMNQLQRRIQELQTQSAKREENCKAMIETINALKASNTHMASAVIANSVPLLLNRF